jgi:hypothetical protein
VALQFDISAIPAGATIESATLSMYCFSNPAPSLSRPYWVYQITAPWSAAEATWNLATATQSWAMPGGDILADAMDTVIHPQSFTSAWDNYDVTTAVCAFVADASTNHGVVISPLRHSGAALLWYSSEHAVDSLRPRVTIVYSMTSAIRPLTRVPPTQGIFGLGGSGTYTVNGRAVAVPRSVSCSGVYLRGRVSQSRRSETVREIVTPR